MVYIGVLTWQEHDIKAQSCGGNLASITTIEELEAIEEVHLIIEGDKWIGGYQDGSCPNEPSDCWEWSDGDPYLNVGTVDFNDSNGSEQCMSITDNSLTWADTTCTTSSYAIYIFQENVGSSACTICDYCTGFFFFSDGQCRCF